MGRLVGYGLRKPAFAGDKEGYMVGVCLQMIIMLSIMLIAYIHFTRHGGLTERSRRHSRHSRLLSTSGTHRAMEASRN